MCRPGPHNGPRRKLLSSLDPVMLLALQTSASRLSFEVGVDHIGGVAFGGLHFFSQLLSSALGPILPTWTLQQSMLTGFVLDGLATVAV